jgi:hypothetical protein
MNPVKKRSISTTSLFKSGLAALAIALLGAPLATPVSTESLTESLDLAYYDGTDFSDEKHRPV